MNKPKLNQPDVETTTTTFNSATGESITMNQTIPSKQFKDIFVTGTTVEEYTPTEEEVKKEWEKDGWVWIINEENVLHLWKKDIYSTTNHITYDLKYKELEFNFSRISIEILERLIKILKALG